jgi:hypothetical protein
MKLNYEILRTELAEKIKCKVGGINNDCGLIESPMLYDQGMLTSPECCYLSESIPPRDGNFEKKTLFIIFGVVLEESLKECKDSILYFSAPQSMLVVMNAIEGIFTKYRQWEEDLHESLLESGSLDALLQLSLPIFENPLFLIDSRFYVLAYAATDLAPDFVRPKEKVPEIWIIQGKDELIRARIVHEEPYYKHLPNDYRRLFINLSEGEYLLGNLSIQASHRELRECDGYLLTHLASVVRTAMLRSGPDVSERRSLLEKMMSEIISGGVVDEEEFKRVLSGYGVTQGEQFRCLAIRIPMPSEKEYIRNFLHHLGTQIPAMYVPTDGEIAAMVLSASRAERQGIDVIAILEDKLKSFGFRVGLSDKYDNWFFTQQYFAQARYALESAEAKQDGIYVSLFADCCLDYILENCTGNLRPSMLWKEGFRRLLEHDINGRADYINTLRAYLDNNLNAQRAAAALHISRNSLLSQLERINALLGEDLRDPKVRFRYELSLLLYDKYINEYSRSVNTTAL